MQIESGNKELIQQPGEHFRNMESCKSNDESLCVFFFFRETAREGEWWVEGLVLAVLKDRVYFHHIDG